MNGAITEPCVATIKAPRARRNRAIGSKHHFFFSLRNRKNSIIIESFPIVFNPQDIITVRQFAASSLLTARSETETVNKGTAVENNLGLLHL